ncbi:Cell division control protein 48 [Giardia duodenalis]|uniref:Cell division control protein 48 n=1 Tax=Giardia intestinalis (strain ATCC 50803 / WB clone C6) TaxID=184922 RepID=A8BAC4_GIAIC|nr:Cell division control protein 48 [Giardia intestinalis]KAE8303534.1 Cell division control protein 48 [Giardia intestinalis]|eukprot:XP_001708360.1 Cell division control protein 48 [Giardia lamblia ATCC 50803]
MNPEILEVLGGSKGKRSSLPGLRRGKAVGAATSVPVWPIVFVSPQFIDQAPSTICRLNFYAKKDLPQRYDHIVELRGAPIASGTYDVPETSPYLEDFSSATRIDVAEYLSLGSVCPLDEVTVTGLGGCSGMRNRLIARLHQLLNGAIITPRTRLIIRIAGHTYHIAFTFPPGVDVEDVCLYAITSTTTLFTDALSIQRHTIGPQGAESDAATSYFRTAPPKVHEVFSLIRARLSNPRSLGIVSALLYGLPGNGKSMFANAAVSRLNHLAIRTNLVTLDLATAVEYLDTHVLSSQLDRPSYPAVLLFIDEIDSEQAEHAFTNFHTRIKLLREGPYRIFILAATNRLASLPLSVVTCSFSLSVEFRAPEYAQRLELLRSNYLSIADMLHKQWALETVEDNADPPPCLDTGPTSIEVLAERFEGLSYADIAFIFVQLRHHILSDKATNLSVSEIQDKLIQLAGAARPSSLLSFDIVQIHEAQIGGLDDELDAIRKMMSSPFTNSLLIYGEPGCGKSQIGRYLSSVLHYPLLSIASTQLIGSYVGETEKAIERVFRIARASQPVIIFWDEIDAVFPTNSFYKYMDRAITTFSSCIDDIVGTKVFLIAATNKPASIHSDALSRFSHKFEITRPATRDQALSIFTACLGGLPLTSELRETLPLYAEKMIGFTGAEIAAVVNLASLNAIARCVDAQQRHFDDPAEAETLSAADFLAALNIKAVH